MWLLADKQSNEWASAKITLTTSSLSSILYDDNYNDYDDRDSGNDDDKGDDDKTIMTMMTLTCVVGRQRRLLDA